MDEEIRIALAISKEQYRKRVGRRKEVRRAQRQQDEFKLINHYQSLPVQDSNDDMKGEDHQQALTTTSNTNKDFLKSNLKIIHYDLDNENDSTEDDGMEYYLQDIETDLDTNLFHDDDAYDVNVQSTPHAPQQIRLHYFTNVSTDEYCQNLTQLLRDAKICKSQSNRLITLIKSVLPQPNYMPSSLKDLFSMMHIEDLFTRRKVCIVCKLQLSCDDNLCKKCRSTDQTTIATIFDVDVFKVLSLLLKRLSTCIEEYKQKIISNNNYEKPNDIPFGTLYRELMEKYCDENIISLVLHLDGVALTKSSKLKLWLFSGSIVELPPNIRHRRYNMALLSIWVGYTEPLTSLWLDQIIDTLTYIKLQNICISPDLNYKLKFFGVTGDCPAIKLILEFIGHNGYSCCWLCYLKGVHVGNKCQYRCELPINHRHPQQYLKESIQAVQEDRDVHGHRGISVLHKILDTPLPECIIIDYLHCTLLGHAKTIIKAIYRQLKPDQRALIDMKLKEQNFPHFFGRKTRPISDFGHVKATEIKNLLLYILLPVLQKHLPLEQLSHLALFICSIRLFHSELPRDNDVRTLADKLFLYYYKDHENYYDNLQNFVLHLHIHYSMIYKNHGSLCNIGCFAQEDLIGSVSSNHHGTRSYGELICYYYNIDFFLHNNNKLMKVKNGPIDPTNQAPASTFYAHDCHEKLCDCHDFNKCIVIYRRCLVHEHMFHSLLYNKRQKCISYFVEYFDNDHMKQRHFGIIEYFFTWHDKVFALIQHYPIKFLYSDYFTTSKYFNLLKKALDSFFFILQSKPNRFDLISVESISKHCIVVEENDHLVVTPVSSYSEHD